MGKTEKILETSLNGIYPYLKKNNFWRIPVCSFWGEWNLSRYLISTVVEKPTYSKIYYWLHDAIDYSWFKLLHDYFISTSRPRISINFQSDPWLWFSKRDWQGGKYNFRIFGVALNTKVIYIFYIFTDISNVWKPNLK